MRIAQWFGGWEAERRAGFKLVAAEIQGGIEIPVKDGVFTLSGIADRIEHAADGATSFSTTRPARREPRSRCAPASRRSSRLKRRCCAGGGFETIPAGGSVSGLAYVLLKGGEPAGNSSRSISRRARPTTRPTGRGKTQELAKRSTDDDQPYLLARPPDVEDALRRLRSPRAGEGMVGHRRRDDEEYADGGE